MKEIKHEPIKIDSYIDLVSHFHTETYEIQRLLNLGIYFSNSSSVLPSRGNFFFVKFRKKFRIHKHFNESHSSCAW